MSCLWLTKAEGMRTVLGTSVVACIFLFSGDPVADPDAVLRGTAIELTGDKGAPVTFGFGADGGFRIGNRHGVMSLSFKEEFVGLRLENANRAASFDVRVREEKYSSMVMSSHMKPLFMVMCGSDDSQMFLRGPMNRAVNLSAGTQSGKVSLGVFGPDAVKLLYLGSTRSRRHSQMAIYGKDERPAILTEGDGRGYGILLVQGRKDGLFSVELGREGTLMTIGKDRRHPRVALTAFGEGIGRISTFDKKGKETLRSLGPDDS